MSKKKKKRDLSEEAHEIVEFFLRPVVNWMCRQPETKRQLEDGDIGYTDLLETIFCNDTRSLPVYLVCEKATVSGTKVGPDKKKVKVQLNRAAIVLFRLDQTRPGIVEMCPGFGERATYVISPNEYRRLQKSMELIG